MPENQEATPSPAAQQEAAQHSDTKAEATSATKASDEFSEDDLGAADGGKWSWKGHGYPRVAPPTHERSEDYLEAVVGGTRATN